MRPLRRVGRPALARPLALGTLAALAAAVMLGVPTGVIDNPWFVRKVPTRSFDVVVLVALALIAGLTAATYARPAGKGPALGRVGIASGVLGWFAVSCPLCNPFVLALLGASGATGIFARLQPALGAVAVALGAGAFALRVRAIRRGACPIAPRAAADRNR
jgi:hypothetical protein